MELRSLELCQSASVCTCTYLKTLLDIIFRESYLEGTIATLLRMSSPDSK